MTTGRINQVSHSFPFVQLSFSETLVEFLLSPARFSGGLHHSTLVPVACWKNSSFSSSQHPLCMRHPRSLIRHTHIMHAASSFPYSPYTHLSFAYPFCMRHPRSLIRHTHTTQHDDTCAGTPRSLVPLSVSPSHPCMRHPRSLIRHTHIRHKTHTFFLCMRHPRSLFRHPHTHPTSVCVKKLLVLWFLSCFFFSFFLSFFLALPPTEGQEKQ